MTPTVRSPPYWSRRRRGVADGSSRRCGVGVLDRAGEREYLRWVRPEEEETLLDALARLHAAGEDSLVEAAADRMFRAHGILVPVWISRTATGAEALLAPVRAFDELLDATLADARPLGPPSVRSGGTWRAGS